MKAWFGEQVDGEWVPGGKTPEELAQFAGKADSAGLSKDVDLERIAVATGICASRAGYLRLMHETAMLLARSRIRALLSARDADIVQSIKALDTVNGAYNEVTERLIEWYGIHYPEARMKPQEIVDLLLKGPPAATGAPLSGEDLDAMRGFAAAAGMLFEERGRLESYIAGCMEDVAPNLADTLGPLLGARLIARAGGLARLARLPASTIQVMGSGEALFRHLREGTPSPKHGFIYRHPLVSGSPKRLRGKISRAVAGKAAIAARVDHYSGEQRPFGEEVREKVSAIRGGRRRGAP